MKSATDWITSMNNWHIAAGFGFNTNLLESNLINLAVVIGVLVYFGKGILSALLNNRKNIILSTIRNTEERYEEAINNLNQARARLQQTKTKADEILINGLYQIQKEQEELIKAADENFKRLEDSKNVTIFFEKQRAIEQVRQQVSKLVLIKTLNTLNSRLNVDLQTRIIDYNLGLLKGMNIAVD